ncbi:MAG TPA: ABC transporter ATP-binding protein [Thermoplasmata archaeon]
MSDWGVERLVVHLRGFRLGPVDLHVPAGGALGVLGPSGSGKTTLLRAVAGLLPLVGGHVRHGSDDLTDLPPESRGIAYVPQGLGLFPHRTVEGNVRYPGELRGDRQSDWSVAALLQRFGLVDLAGRRPGTLSSGEQQRVAIARALAARPGLLLWDEPLTALDLPARDDLLDALHQVQERDRLPVVFVSHDPALAFSLADRFLLLDHGSVEFAGPAERMVRAPSSPFAARFAGFENVYPAEALGGGASRPWLDWLERHAGASGVCLRAPRLTPSAEGEWSAVVRRAEPGPDGWRYDTELDGVRVRVRSTDDAATRAGATVRFSVRPEDLVPIGPSGDAP